MLAVPLAFSSPPRPKHHIPPKLHDVHFIYSSTPFPPVPAPLPVSVEQLVPVLSKKKKRDDRIRTWDPDCPWPRPWHIEELVNLR